MKGTPVCVSALRDVVYLLLQDAGILGVDPCEVPAFFLSVQLLRQALERLQVNVKQLLQAWPLHLHHHLLPTVQHRSMHLQPDTDLLKRLNGSQQAACCVTPALWTCLQSQTSSEPQGFSVSSRLCSTALCSCKQNRAGASHSLL